MKKSLRRVSNALLGVGVALVFMGVLMSLIGNCTVDGGKCLTATVLFGLPESPNALPDLTLSTDTAASTQVQSTKTGTFTLLNKLIEDLGVSLIFVAVIGILVLELIELHYIRRFFFQKKMIGR